MKAMREAYGEALVELGGINPEVVVLDADVSSSTRSALFKKAYPNRFFNVGIAEANMMSIAAGLATAGKVPFVNSFALFCALRAGDQVRSLIAYNKLNVKIAGTYAGFSDSYDGASHQAVEDVGVMRAIPHMTIVAPADEHAMRCAVLAAARYQGPVYLRISRAEVPPVYDAKLSFEIGKAIVARPGSDVSIFAYGYMVSKSLAAAEALAAEGIQAEVIDMHTIKPLDAEAVLQSVRKTGAAVTTEEHNIYGGLGSAVAEVLAKHCLGPLEIVGIHDSFGESGAYEALLTKYGLDKTAIVAAARKAIAGRKKAAAAV